MGCDGADVLWEKEYEGVLVRNGEMQLELSEWIDMGMYWY